MKRYDQVVVLVPWNVAARRRQQRVDNTKTDYGEEAYNETCAPQLWQSKRLGATGRPLWKRVGPITDVTTKEVTGAARNTGTGKGSPIFLKANFKQCFLRRHRLSIVTARPELDPAVGTLE
jgi:hypothetical protein